MKKNLPILVISSTEGHLSLANAMVSGLKSRGFTNVSLFVENTALKPYVLYYRYAPWLHQVVDIFLGKKLTVQITRKLFIPAYKSLVQRIEMEYKPKIVLSTNYALNQNFEALERSKNIPYLNMICDPRSYIRINVAQEAGTNLTFDTKQQAMITQDFPSVATEAIGWPVRPEFAPAKAVAAAKQALGADPNRFAALVVAGSEGMQRLQDTVRTIALQGKPMTLFVACGKNKLLLFSVKELAKEYSTSPVQIVPFGFTPSIAPYFQAADVVLGKAGPNMIFEAVACHKPFIATTSIAGQELGNLDLIKEFQIGFVEEDTKKAAELVVAMNQDPKIIEGLLPNIVKLANYNQGTIDRLVAVMEKVGKD